MLKVRRIEVRRIAALARRAAHAVVFGKILGYFSVKFIKEK